MALRATYFQTKLLMDPVGAPRVDLVGKPHFWSFLGSDKSQKMTKKGVFQLNLLLVHPLPLFPNSIRRHGWLPMLNT